MAKLPKSIIKKYGITKKAWRVFRGRKRKSRSPKKTRTSRRIRRRTNPKGGKRSMGKSRGLNSRTVFSITKGIALIAPAAASYIQFRNSADKGLVNATEKYTGYNIYNATFNLGKLAEGYGPFVGVTLAQKAVTLINRLLR